MKRLIRGFISITLPLKCFYYTWKVGNRWGGFVLCGIHNLNNVNTLSGESHYVKKVWFYNITLGMLGIIILDQYLQGIPTNIWRVTE